MLVFHGRDAAHQNARRPRNRQESAAQYSCRKSIGETGGGVDSRDSTAASSRGPPCPRQLKRPSGEWLLCANRHPCRPRGRIINWASRTSRKYAIASPRISASASSSISSARRASSADLVVLVTEGVDDLRAELGLLAFQARRAPQRLGRRRDFGRRGALGLLGFFLLPVLMASTGSTAASAKPSDTRNSWLRGCAPGAAARSR